MQNHFIRALAVFFVATSIASWSQTPSAPIGAAPKPKLPHASMLPYTAEYKATTVQTLANGTTITRESSSVRARGAQNRFYTAETQPSRAGEPPITLFHISDPVAGTETRWNLPGEKAFVYVLPPAEERHGCWKSESGNNSWGFPLTPEQRAAENGTQVKEPVVLRPQSQHPKTESLGTDVIQGLTVRGTRVTFTTPIGEVGNDQPLVRTTENWQSEEYGITVRSISDDPRQGKTTRELISFTPGEPDPTLFQPPQGYEVVTEPLHQVPCQR